MYKTGRYTTTRISVTFPHRTTQRYISTTVITTVVTATEKRPKPPVLVFSVLHNLFYVEARPTVPVKHGDSPSLTRTALEYKKRHTAQNKTELIPFFHTSMPLCIRLSKDSEIF